MPFNLGVSRFVTHISMAVAVGIKVLFSTIGLFHLHKISATTILEVIVGPFVAAPLRLLSAFFVGPSAPGIALFPCDETYLSWDGL